MSDQSNGQTNNEPSARTFNPNDHLIQLKAKDGYKDYLPVQWRLVWFREQCPNGTVVTEEVFIDLDREVEEDIFAWNAEKRRSEKITKHGRGYARFRAVVTDGKGGSATGTKSENAASFPDFIEKAETGAIGRALAALGYGTQFAPEIDEARRVVDSPVERNQSALVNSNGNSNAHSNGRGTHPSAESDAPSSITEQQIASIRKLSEHLNKALPDTLPTYSFIDARKLIQQLTAEYREAKQRKAS
jgi:hypothetical protein